MKTRSILVLAVVGSFCLRTNPAAALLSYSDFTIHEGDTISGAEVVKIRKDTVEFSFNRTTWRQSVTR